MIAFFSSVLTIVAKRMFHQGILGKKLEIVETFNCVSMIATDKTGTLTENKLTVANVLWDTDGEYKVAEFEEEPITKPTIQPTIRHLSIIVSNIAHRGSVEPIQVSERLSNGIANQSDFRSSISSEMEIEAFRDLLLGAALCNDAERQLVQDGYRDQGTSEINTELRLIGDAVDLALYKLCVYGCHMEINEIRCLNPRLKVLPFNSSNKFMISANRLEPYDLSSIGNEVTILITLKGAPDIVIQRCSSYKTNDKQVLPLTVQIKEKFFTRQETLGKILKC